MNDTHAHLTTRLPLLTTENLKEVIALAAQLEENQREQAQTADSLHLAAQSCQEPL